MLHYLLHSVYSLKGKSSGHTCCINVVSKLADMNQKNFCQNPNLTTTQPQPNFNLVGFDMIITLHTPPPPPGTLLLPEIMILGV